MENIFIDISGMKINKLFWSTSASLEAIIEKLEDFMVENESLYEKIEEKNEEIEEKNEKIEYLEEKIEDIKQDMSENYTPNPTNYYIDLGLRESDFH